MARWLLVIAVGCVGLLAWSWVYRPQPLPNPISNAPHRPSSSIETPRIVAAVQAVIVPGACTPPVAAETGLRRALDEIGARDWTIQAGQELARAECVTATVDPDTWRVIVVPALQPAVRVALDQVRDDLYRQCLNRDDAVAYVKAALDAAGAKDYELRSDGPITAPVDRQDEVFRHVDAGCWIYSGTGWAADGQRRYFVAGK